MHIEFGNLHEIDTAGTGWFVGYSEWTKSGEGDLRFMPQDAPSHGVSAKWMFHPQGDTRGSSPPKPISEGRSLNVMLTPGGIMRIQFSLDPAFPASSTEERALRRFGDFSAWGAGLYHRTFFDADCTILTLRWVPG